MPEIKDIQALLNELSKGDSHAFHRIFNSFSGMVYSFSLRLTRSTHTAEEIVQEVFLKIWTQRETLAQVGNFPGYLFTVTRNLTLNVLKHKVIEDRARSVLRNNPWQHNETQEAIIYHDYEELLNKAINHLPPQQRLVYSMCHQEGLRYEEVARKLKISRFTVKTHMQHALRSLKTQFGGIVRASVVLFFLGL